MLHEILLSLSGLPSPIWEDLRTGRAPNDRQDRDESLGSLTSPAEKAMVAVLAELADLHIKVRDATTAISTSHPSPVCRAAANRIKTHHLRAFVEKIIAVETSILDQDAAYVGAYRIVPLSTVVSDFQPWIRPMRWFWKIVQSLKVEGTVNMSPSSGAAILCSLRDEAQTGYTDIKAIAEDLLEVTHRSWLHNLMPWVLYGQTPSFGAADFMIQTRSSSAVPHLQYNLVPYFITTHTAETILSIGLALRQITPRAGHDQVYSGLTSSCTSLMPASLQKIKSLQLPLQAVEVSKVATSINDTISQAALSVILPTTVIYDLLIVLQEYVLFRNGEFSTCLIQQIDRYLTSHQAGTNTSKPVRKLGKTDDLNFNESETSTILDKTWSELSAFVPEKDSDNQIRDRAAELLRLVKPSTTLPVNSLLPNSASLCLQIPPNSPLTIFISTADINVYRTLSAYLVSIRRAEFQLTKLWREPSLRRCYPPPLRPPQSNTPRGRHLTTKRRQRETNRSRSLRQHWASISQLLFLISELSSYLQGEVLQNSWTQFETWLDFDTSSGNHPTSPKTSSRPNTATSHIGHSPAHTASHPTFNKQNQDQDQKQNQAHTINPPSQNSKSNNATKLSQSDPRIISNAHSHYLTTLTHSLLLTHQKYTTTLTSTLTQIDHYVALFHRLQTIWSALDLQEEEAAAATSSVNNVLKDLPREEKEVLTEMKRTNQTVSEVIRELIAVLRGIERERGLPELTSGVVELELAGGGGRSGGSGKSTFEPWRARTLDRLLMKLDSLAGEDRDGNGDDGEEGSDRYEDALVDLNDL